MIDIMDVDAIVEKCKEDSVDGVLAFCIDPAQMPYQKICEQLNKPCYGTLAQFRTLTDKRLFKDYCLNHGVGIIPEYSEDDIKKGCVQYPILIKPRISRGSRGQTVCHSIEDCSSALALAKAESPDGNVLIEKYMIGAQDMSFAYIVINGEPYLLKCGDRIVGAIEDGLDRQQIATILPSIHAEQYVAEIEPSIKDMIKSLGIKFGAVFLQGFWEDGKIYMYDPGMRFPGGGYDIVMGNCTGFNNMKSFVYFALTGDVTSCFGDPNSLYNLNGKACIILSIACRPGIISCLDGLDIVTAHPWVYSTSKRYDVGDTIPASGDIKQRVAEFVAELPSRESVKTFVDFVYSNISILDSDGNDMIVSRVILK